MVCTFILTFGVLHGLALGLLDNNNNRESQQPQSLQWGDWPIIIIMKLVAEKWRGVGGGKGRLSPLRFPNVY